MRSVVKSNWKIGIPLPGYNRIPYTSCTNKYHMRIGIILQGCYEVRQTAFRGKVTFQ